MWYKGTIKRLQQVMPGPGASVQEIVDFDPWEAVAVEWDASGHNADSSHDLVGPWEIEVGKALAAELRRCM